MNKQKTDMMQKYAQDLDSTRVVKTFAQLFAEIYFAKMIDTSVIPGNATGFLETQSQLWPKNLRLNVIGFFGFPK